MKKIYQMIALSAFLTVGHTDALLGQTIRVRDKAVEKADSTLLVGMALDLDELHVPAGRSLVCTPVIRRGDSLRALPPLIVNGRDRHILYVRSGRSFAENGEYELRRKNGEKQSFSYQARTPFARWMEKGEVLLVTDECGCGWESLQQGESPLFTLNLAQPVVLRPVLAYRTPTVEKVKARAKEGSAFLDFPVNQIRIYPDYRDNPRELKAIRETVESVRDDKYATITEVYIKGYASPEGGYANNAYLAENRAKALRDYVEGLYHFDHARFTVDSEPEDWEGLEKRVEASSLPDKADLLAIIRADEPSDPDKREAKLKTLHGGSAYKVLLRDIYPALRHSDYAVKYTIRNFSVEEAKGLLYTDPKQLSLNEMFQVAQTYEPGSEPFREVFDIAVRIYPDDPVSNLNAANIAIASGQTERAQRYLAKADNSPEKQLAESALAMLAGDLDRAEQLLRPLQEEPQVADAAKANLEQIRLKREE